MVFLLQLLLFLVLLPSSLEYEQHLVTFPNNPPIEMGTNFTATCAIVGTDEVTADDLYWKLSTTVVPRENYRKINRTALEVTVLVTEERPQWLLCVCSKQSSYVDANKGRFYHGIYIKPGYRPEKPENLSCVANQEGEFIAPVLSCEWESNGRQTKDVPLVYTLFVQDVLANKTFNASSDQKSAQVKMGPAFGHFMPLNVWVEAHNDLGRVSSDHLENNGNFFVKTRPPSNVSLISEENFPTSLLINWSHPIAGVYLRLIYHVRFCPRGSHVWNYVPRADTSKYISSFRLQNLRPDTVYSVQVRCKHSDHGVGYWSDWSSNSTRRTHEDRPSSKPDLWMNVIQSKTNERQVQILCKDPEFSNGKILRFDFKVQNQADRAGNGTDWESFPVNGSEDDDGSGDDPRNQRNSVLLKTLVLSDKQSIKVRVIAVNSVGASPEAFLVLTAKSNDPSPVQNLQVHSLLGRLWLDFKPRNNNTFPSAEYVMEWTEGGNVDWQREKKNTHRAAIKGDLQPFVCYNVSVYPVYSGRVGKPTRTEAFLEQGAPSLGPSVRLKGNARHDSAELEWEEIPLQNRRGFITNYTVSYRAGNRETNHVTVPANTTSYTLTQLHHDTRYDVWIRASTIRGFKDGNSHSFTTLKYGPGMIESIIVAVSLGFFMFFLLCLYKRDQIRENFWPQIPNPGESTIGNWSPDCSTKEESEKESCVSGISVLDVCESKPGPEEDKASLSLKKDKYLSEENSSGIGGSSCMSSPRQSVSDSDEADAADTSASTVQYSSVVAPRGYKGQTPGSHGSHGSQTQPGVFWRSESTQPLLDSEENPDMSVQDSRLFQRSPGSSCFTPGDGEEQPEWEQQDLSSVEENGETTAVPDRLTDVLPAGAPGAPGAPASSYMPQLGGYRPQ